MSASFQSGVLGHSQWGLVWSGVWLASVGVAWGPSALGVRQSQAAFLVALEFWRSVCLQPVGAFFQSGLFASSAWRFTCGAGTWRFLGSGVPWQPVGGSRCRWPSLLLGCQAGRGGLVSGSALSFVLVPCGCLRVGRLVRALVAKFFPEGWRLWAKTRLLSPGSVFVASCGVGRLVWGVQPVVAWTAGFCSQMPLGCLEPLGTVFPWWG